MTDYLESTEEDNVIHVNTHSMKPELCLEGSVLLSMCSSLHRESNKQSS